MGMKFRSIGNLLSFGKEDISIYFVNKNMCICMGVYVVHAPVCVYTTCVFFILALHF